jgi:uncharacterized protein (TIGR02598 family)
MRNRPSRRDAFTLVEVMLSLAIVSIGLIAILGLLPTGLRSARDAADNTLSATVVQDVFSTIRTQPFANVDLTAFNFTGGPYNLNGNYLSPPLPLIVAYFDQAGFTVPLAKQPQDNYYQVSLTFSNQAAALSLVTATVVWPAHSVHPLNTNIFVTEVAQYQ